MTAPATITSPAALQCRICGAQYPVEPLTICEECFGPLEPAYDLQSIDGCDFRKQVEAGPATLWRYQSLLPGGPGIERIDLGAGFTPLRRADNLADARSALRARCGSRTTRVNPSNSFKDRVVSVATTMARAFGFEAISCASTGNLANATAAHAAKAGMPCFVFVPDDLERAKILATEAYGAKVVAVKGNYDEVNRLCTEVAEALPWAFVNVNMRPYYAEGSKSLGFETAEQLGWRLPDHVVVPIASGRAAHEDPPRLPGADRDRRRRREALPGQRRPARRLPAGGAGVPGRRRGGHAGEAGHDRAIARDRVARRRLLRDAGGARDRRRTSSGAPSRRSARASSCSPSTEGVFTETAGGVTIANLKRMAEQGIIKPDEEVVAYVTGNGYKTIEALEGFLEPTYHVAPDLDEFLAALDA